MNNINSTISFGKIGAKKSAIVFEEKHHGALSHFEDFLIKKDLSSESDNEDVICNILLFQEFAFYLMNMALKKNTIDPTPLKTSSAIANLGNVKEYIRSKYPQNIIWQGHDSEKGGKNNSGGWYTLIRIEMERCGLIRAIEQGVSEESKSTPLGRSQVSNMVTYLLSSNAETGVYESLYVVTTFISVGRAGEAGWASWKQAEVNYIENVLDFQWNEHKTARQSQMNAYPDMETFTLDFYFLSALYFILGAGCEYMTQPFYEDELINNRKMKTEDIHKCAFMFPGLVKNATKCIGDIISKCKGSVHGIHKSGTFTPKSLRMGALQEVIIRCGHRAAAIFRGGWWNLEYEQTFYEYMSGCFELLRIAGLAISGYPKHVKHVFTPTCEAILRHLDANEQQKLTNFVFELFQTKSDILQIHDLQDFGWIMFASLLRFLPDYVDLVTDGHNTIVKLIKLSKEYGYTYKILIEWGDIIRNDFYTKNVHIHASDHHNDPIIQLFQSSIISLNVKLASQESYIKQVDKKLDYVIQLLKDIQISYMSDRITPVADKDFESNQPFKRLRDTEPNPTPQIDADSHTLVSTTTSTYEKQNADINTEHNVNNLLKYRDPFIITVDNAANMDISTFLHGLLDHKLIYYIQSSNKVKNESATRSTVNLVFEFIKRMAPSNLKDFLDSTKPTIDNQTERKIWNTIRHTIHTEWMKAITSEVIKLKPKWANKSITISSIDLIRRTTENPEIIQRRKENDRIRQAQKRSANRTYTTTVQINNNNDNDNNNNNI